MKKYRTHAKAWLLSCLSLLAIPSAVAQTAALQTPTEGVYGELRQWHQISVAFAGPNTNENANPNPFTNYRLDVTFTHSGGASITVPGYYAADGSAGETSAAAGNIWRVHFRPWLTGTWNYTANFVQGGATTYINGGTANNTINGKNGSFNVQASNKTGRDFRAHGRLQYVNKHHLRHQGSGRYFFKFGADSPENPIAYVDFDNTPSSPTDGRSGVRHTWQPHVVNWNTGDPQWQGTKGRGLIGALNYLAGVGAHSWSTLVYSIDGGDDRRIFPWTAQNTKVRFDCSKLDQWAIAFNHANNVGLNCTIKLAEEENYRNLTGNNLRLQYREMVARFGHNLGVQWVISEEFGGFNGTDAAEAADIRNRGDILASLDPWDNLLTTHTGPGDGSQNGVYNAIYGRQSFTGASVQIAEAATQANRVFNRTLFIRNQSVNANRPWVVANDEQGPANRGVALQTDLARKHVIWGNFMAGGAGTEFYINDPAPGVNLDARTEDYRVISTMWNWAGNCVNDFIYGQNIPFWDMANANNLTVGGAANWCLADAGNAYVVYMINGGTTSLNLSGQTGNFEVKWFNPRNGGSLLNGSVTTVTGGGTRALGTAPNSAGSDWAILVRPAGAAPSGNGTPFGGTARAIPGTIEAEDFNVGGQGVAYNDNDAGNNGTSTYRSGENVDIFDGNATDPARGIGWVVNGEFLNYDVNVTPGTFNVVARVASNVINPGDLNITIDGGSLGTFAVEGTGGWRNFQEVTIPNITLGIGGLREMRLTAVGGDFNIDSIRFETAGGNPGGGTDTVDVSGLPADRSPASTYDVVVPYTASQTRSLVVAVIDQSGPTPVWRGNGVAEVPAGSSTANITVNIVNPTTDPLAAGNYQWVVSLRPPGTGFDMNVAEEAKSFTVSTGGGPAPAAGISFDDVANYQNQSFAVGSNLPVTVNYSAGPGNTVGAGGITFWLRQLNADYSVVRDVTVTNTAVAGTVSGTASGTIAIPTDLPLTANLATGQFYFLYATFNDNAGVARTIGLQPVIIVGAPATNTDTVDVTGLPTERTSASTYDVVVPYTASTTLSLVVAVFDLSGPTPVWRGNGTAQVTAGSSTANVTVNIISPSTAPLAAGNYQWVVSMRPPGTDFNSNVVLETSNFTVTGGSGTGNFQEQNGLLIMEAESATLPAGWVARTGADIPAGDPQKLNGFTGSGWIEWTGAQFFGLQIQPSQANGLITYTFDITNPGTYSFRWRTKQKDAGQTFDAGNDSFVRFASGTNPPGAENFGTLTKVFIQEKQVWALDVRAEPRIVNGQAVFVANAFTRNFTAGTHTIQISARSPGHVIDRLILHRSDVPFNANQFATAPESPRAGGGNNGGGNPGGGGTPQTVNLTPAADVFIQNSTTINDNLLRVESSARVRTSYLRFNVTGVSGTVTGAKLRLDVPAQAAGGDAGTGTVQVFVGSGNAGWTEANITSTNAPTQGAQIGSKTGAFGLSTTHEIDLTPAQIPSSGNVTLIVKINNTQDIAFSSSEGVSAPQLTITSQ